MTRQQPRRRTETVVCAEVTNPIHKSRWRRAWNEVIPFLDYPPEVRRLTEWKRSVREWHAVKSQLAIMFEERFPMA